MNLGHVAIAKKWDVLERNRNPPLVLTVGARTIVRVAHGVGFVMTEQTYSVEATARQFIDNCRREISAAMLQIEAARAILVSSRWLLTRWEESQRAGPTGGIHLPAYDEAHATGFVGIEPPRRRRRRHLVTSHVRRAASPDRRNRRRAASG